MSASDDEEYMIPLQDKRVFGAGIKRKRVQFVRANDSTTTIDAPTTSSGPSASDFYLNLVLPKAETKITSTRPAFSQTDTSNNAADKEASSPKDSDINSKVGQSDRPAPAPGGLQAQIVCETCHLPIDTSSSTTPHQALFAHQLSLPHSHPPSSLSRTHPGLRILQSQGWDPDSRLGLGATGSGIRFPIKAKEKSDRLGIGASIPLLKKGDAEVSKAVQEAKVKKAKEDMRGKKGKGWLKKQDRKSTRLNSSHWE